MSIDSIIIQSRHGFSKTVKTALLVGVLGVGFGVIGVTKASAEELLDMAPDTWAPPVIWVPIDYSAPPQIPTKEILEDTEPEDTVFYTTEDEQKIYEIIHAYLEQGYFITGVSIGESDTSRTLASLPADSDIVIDTANYHTKGYFLVDDQINLVYLDYGVTPVSPEKIARVMEHGAILHQMRDLDPARNFAGKRLFEGVGILIDGAALRDDKALRTATPDPPAPADIAQPDTYTVEIFPPDFINVAAFSFLHPVQCAALREDKTGSTSPQ